MSKKVQVGRPSMGEYQDVKVRFPAKIVARIDEVRGDVPRSAWIRRACETALEKQIGLAHDNDLRIARQWAMGLDLTTI